MHTPTIRNAARTMLSFAAATAALGFAAGCGNDDKSSAKPASFAMDATAQGKKLTLTFPATVKAGLVTMTLKNSDKGPRSAEIIRIVGDHSVDDVLKVVNDESGGPIPDWMEDGGGVSTVASGKTKSITQNLAPGTYAIFDSESGDNGPANADLGAKGKFTVTGDASDDALPSVDATITATDKGDKGYRFTSEGLKAGANEVRFENTGKQLHHALLFPYAKGATLADVKKFAKSTGNSGGPPPFDFENGDGTSVIDGGIAQNVELDLKAGKYVLLCFIQDRKGGKPHVAKGMLTELDIK